ncbi:hypothetical protein CASFOL_009073 [Castilleja foliolosa]|uniref:RING-CH-type domain-containing protein n=1 Tax=Castilleja foliolosa TaxID=1961234 RepID=A0ABD3E0S3_9LAMI
MSEIVLKIDDLRSYSEVAICRICHEEEEEFESLETPCACSGTLKFAHRACVQRWCNEKGNTVCEICLQKFESGYIFSPKKTQQIDTTLTVRSAALILTGLLVMRQLFVVLTGQEGTYPFSLLTVFIAKASGVILPMYILFRISAALHKSIIHHHQIYDVDSRLESSEDEEEQHNFNETTD